MTIGRLSIYTQGNDIVIEWRRKCHCLLRACEQKA